MTDIFLSYARKDNSDSGRVRLIAETLEAQGYDVFWDARIPGGVDFTAYIEGQLNQAKSVVVLWSKASVGSVWVRDEAGSARDLGRLIPVLLDDVAPPLGFRQIQAIDFRSWAGETDSASWRSLSGALAQFGLKGKAKAWRVLIVEDEVTAGMVIEKMVTDLGHEVVAVEFIVDCVIRAATDLKPDIILMDVQLGGREAKSGIDIAREIEHLGIPVVYTTGSPEEVTRNVPGKPVYLTKPFSEPALGAVLNHMLNKAR
jgi:CheY-like chemotaxis protein